MDGKSLRAATIRRNGCDLIGKKGRNRHWHPREARPLCCKNFLVNQRKLKLKKEDKDARPLCWKNFSVNQRIGTHILWRNYTVAVILGRAINNCCNKDRDYAGINFGSSRGFYFPTGNSISAWIYQKIDEFSGHIRGQV
ncbi:Uncharacterized protein Fot_09628 [Forsythia ovata]|uniref:Uncharacterized protein n=1 Tax=Forsythia ovata TaxID=205694 RepID=A0ABD1WEK4_9LAMI